MFYTSYNLVYGSTEMQHELTRAVLSIGGSILARAFNPVTNYSRLDVRWPTEGHARRLTEVLSGDRWTDPIELEPEAASALYEKIYNRRRS